MKFLKGLGGMFGYIIGAAIILPLLLLAYNYFFINKNNAAQYMDQYIKNVTDLRVTILQPIPSNVPDNYENRDKYPIYIDKEIFTSLATKNMGRENSRKSLMRYRIFYDSHYNKYFSIIMFDLMHKGMPFMRDDFWFVVNDNVTIRVEKTDLQNAKMGTKANPIPVFKVWGADKPLLSKYKADGQPIALDVSDEQYRYNVMMYLTYLMPKKEFQERFEKAKK